MLHAVQKLKKNIFQTYFTSFSLVEEILIRSKIRIYIYCKVPEYNVKAYTNCILFGYKEGCDVILYVKYTFSHNLMSKALAKYI